MNFLLHGHHRGLTLPLLGGRLDLLELHLRLPVGSDFALTDVGLGLPEGIADRRVSPVCMPANLLDLKLYAAPTTLTTAMRVDHQRCLGVLLYLSLLDHLLKNLADAYFLREGNMIHDGGLSGLGKRTAFGESGGLGDRAALPIFVFARAILHHTLNLNYRNQTSFPM